MDQSLDLAVNGNLPGGTKLELQLSDQSIPVTVGGSSMELRELDQISFNVVNGPASATLGDYHYSIDNFEFARVERKLEGVRGEWKSDGFSVSGAGAVSPGKFASFDFYGVEGKQGPYQLMVDGLQGSGDFIVLANTERVYLDGVLLDRGEGKDYTIDYNSSAVTFTSRRLIGSDSRIEVDFEYSERGKRGTFYATTFEASRDNYPLGIKGYLLREVESGDSALVGEASPTGEKDDRVGIAYDYRTSFGFGVEGEGAYQSGLSTGSSPVGSGRSTGAFWVRTGLQDISLFDRKGKADRWKWSWYEKGVLGGFSYPGRRYSPDFRWEWGLPPVIEGREDWRVFDIGFDHKEEIGLGFEVGKIRRGSGEYAFRKKLGGSLTGDSRLVAVEGEIFTIDSRRLEEGSDGTDHLRPAYGSGRSLTVRGTWTGWVPSLAYSSRTELVGDEERTGDRFNEILPSIQGSIAENVNTYMGLRLREEKVLTPESGDWTRDARLFQGRAEVEYRGDSSMRVKGSTEFRRKTYYGDTRGEMTTIIGRGEFLTSGWDRIYSSSTTYELNSTSNVLRHAVFVPEQEDEGEYLEDGTYVGPGNGTHIRQTVQDAEGDGRVLGAELTGIQNVDLSSLIGEKDWSLVSLSHTSTVSIQNERIGDDRWRVYLFLPARSGGEVAELYRSIQYRGEFDAVWGEESDWTTTVDLEYMDLLDRRYSNLSQHFMQRGTGFKIGGSLENGLDVEADLSLKRRMDSGSYNQSTDLREKRVGSELGYRPTSQVRYYIELDLGLNKDIATGTRLRDGTVGPGLNVFLGGGGNLNLQYSLEKIWNDTPDNSPPLVMLAGRDVGTTHHYQLRGNWRLKGTLDFTASLIGRKRPGFDYFENTGRTDFTYRF
jgi:hypothetical protein